MSDPITIEAINAQLEQRDTAIQAALTALETASGDQIANIRADLAAQAESGLRLHASLIEVSQRMADQIGAFGGPGNAPQSFSQTALSSPAFAAVLAGQAKTGRFTTAGSWHGGTHGAVIGSGTTGEGNGGALLQPDYRPGIIRQPDMPLLIRDLLMPGRTSAQVVTYFREVGFTNAAEFVSENTRKPQSDAEFEFAEAPVRTLAHFVKATNQILSDVPALRSYIDFRLRWGVKYVENDALLNGTGTGQSIEGLKPAATPYQTARNQVGDTRIDTLRRAMTQVDLAFYPVSGFILHPDDWESIELTKTTDGAYVFANPLALAGPTLWGRPVIATAAQTAGEFTLGAFNMAAQIFDREDITVEIATENEDDFVNNRVTIRGEERLALAIHRPEAVVDGQFPQT
jgi:HK97 family phage major capsid protein